ncbi:hypothetical protein L5515_013440 [Caenorhabditis briggsae]|uniref:E2F/DP family winged-helix DNA-binding domain-containing protein n=3 Tax=Caenorhabditis briggsae TaxID=6238 RepID=A0AAE9DIU8_CAEBR|nr:hypothetical protein L3Y34_017297 [Caenorhabditis briggsae]UMM16426.1 hypothetical protein L5515_013440 [Caenorhabditis briggsae]
MTANVYGSSNAIFLTIEANKENIPPGTEIDIKKEESFLLPEPRGNRPADPDTESLTASPVPRPSPATSQLSDASFLSQDPTVTNSADESEDDPEFTSRKEKSLGLLCQRFLISINEETQESPTKEVHLETVARKMCVEKRRIYDIVNVMEALDAMHKTNKSYYQWQGLESLPRLMADLQAEAIEEGLPDRVLRVEQAMCSFTELQSPRGNKGIKDTVGSFVSGSSAPTTPTTSFEPRRTETEKRSRVDSRDRQGRNSLAQLCRRFLMVLLSNPKNVRKVSLDVASTVLIKDPETEGFEPPSRSRCRRLYDIANVLVALGLIKKVHYLFGTKKIPLFVYCGPEPDEHASFDVFQSVERLLSSPQNVPQTPVIKAQTDKMVQQIAGFGKRTLSEQNLSKPIGNSPKIAKIKSEMSPMTVPVSPMADENRLFMFAELAAAQKMQEDLAQLSRSLMQRVNTPMAPMTAPISSPMVGSAPPPLPMAPLNLSGLGKLPPLVFPPTQLPNLPNTRPKFNFPDYNPTQSTIRPLVSQMTFRPELFENNPIPPPQPPKHLMSNILGESKSFKNMQNTNNNNFFDHNTKSSAFHVVVKKDEQQQRRTKKVFGEIQNLQ